MPNPLGVFLCHEHACEAIGEALHVLINCCMHEIVLLHARLRDRIFASVADAPKTRVIANLLPALHT